MEDKTNTSIILLSSVFPPADMDAIIAQSKGPIQYAADALNKSFIEGMGAHEPDMVVVNCPFINSWPQYNRSIFPPKAKSDKYELKNGTSLKMVNLRFTNLIGWKMLSKSFHLKRALTRYCKQNRDKERIYIVTYSLHSPYHVALLKIKKRFKNVRLITIVPDLPEFMNGRVSWLRQRLINMNVKLMRKIYHDLDGYVLLSKYMADQVCVKGQPWELVEGIYNPSDTPEIIESRRDDDTAVMLYTGTLEKRYGIMNLVNAVRQCKTEGIRLEVYGDGEAREEIKALSVEDPRIVYGGQLKRSEILKKQHEADLLINPRTPEGEFTKYSFPSKTMEYLASGTPTLLYRLPGIPDEYYDYCYSLEDLTVEGLSAEIDRILQIDKAERTALGEKAREFILTKKNPEEQCVKVLKLINKID